MSTVQFYTEQASRCRRDADAATLANVKERLLESASSWDAMAERMNRMLTQRGLNEAAKAEAAANEAGQAG